MSDSASASNRRSENSTNTRDSQNIIVSITTMMRENAPLLTKLARLSVTFAPGSAAASIFSLSNPERPLPASAVNAAIDVNNNVSVRHQH